MSGITLNAVGDVWFGDHPVRIGHGVGSTYGQRATTSEGIFANVERLLAGGHINFCNLESVLSNAGRRGWWLPSIEMRGSPRAAHVLRAAGFNLVSVANNHMMQHGAQCYRETVQLLRQIGIAAVGCDDAEGRSNIVRMDIQGVHIAVMAFSLRPEEYFVGKPLYSQRSSLGDVLDEVARAAASGADFLVCSLHWGTEYMDMPETAQVEFAHQLIDAGVHVVLGHHPHVLQGYEQYRHGLILYSLGNFVFDLWPRSTRKSAIVHINLEKGQRPSVRFTPIWLDDAYRPTIATGELANEILTEIECLSRRIDARELSTPEEYRLMARQEENAVRSSGYRYFAQNLHRYPANMLLQSVGRTVLRRLTGR